MWQAPRFTRICIVLVISSSAVNAKLTNQYEGFVAKDFVMTQTQQSLLTESYMLKTLAFVWKFLLKFSMINDKDYKI